MSHLTIEGHWHEYGSAAQHDAALRVKGHEFTLLVPNRPDVKGSLEDLKISDRLGDIERKLTLIDGSVFASHDNASIDAWLNQEEYLGQNRLIGTLHALESNLGWVLLAIVMTVATSISFLKWGVPWVSNQVAYALPHKANEVIADHSLEFLDAYFFNESQLEDQRQEAIETHFESFLLPLVEDNSEIDYALHFRQWGEGDDSIPNAFALPSGDIILTDRFVELSQNQDEIDAVLFHEIGHVVYRHTLETVVQSTLVATIVMMVTGDSNGLADMGVGLGSLLVSSTYSRNNESEADLYAFNKMLTAGLDPNAFSIIMKAIMQELEKPELSELEKETSEEKKTTIPMETANRNGVKDNGLLDYLSSHPSTEKRIKLAEQFSDCFNQGLSVCDVGAGK